MTTQISTGLRNSMLASDSYKGIMDAGSEIRVYKGAVPAHPDDATTGATLILTLKNGSSGVTMDASASGGVLVKNPSETWSGVVGGGGGTPTFFRHVMTGDADGASSSAPRLQGSAGGGGADLFLSSGALTAGVTQPLTYFQVGLPE